MTPPSPNPIDSAKEKEALPCPFCGSDKITVEWEPCQPLSDGDTNRRWFAECSQCSCQGPFCQKEPQVIHAWNTRAYAVHMAELQELLRSACHIAERQGVDVHWERFAASIRKVGLSGITARTYRILESDKEL